MVPLFQFPCVLSCQLRSVCVEDDEHRKSETGGIPITLDHILVMALVHVDQDYDVVLLNDLGEFGVGFEQTAQFVAPASPVGAKLEDDPFTLRFSDFEGVGDLLFAIRGRVVKLGFGICGLLSTEQGGWAGPNQERDDQRQET